MKQSITKEIEELAVKILTGKTLLSESEKKEIYDPDNLLGNLSEAQAKERLKGWMENISDKKRKKILSKMD